MRLNNIYVLYFLLALVIINILYLLQTQQTKSLLIMILVGLITYSIKENWIIVFFVSLVLTNVLLNTMEGFETKEKGQKKHHKVEDNNEVDGTEVDGTEEDGTEEVTPILQENQNDTPMIIDDSATIQASYDNLQKFLDSPGFNKLTDETHKLAKSQDKLMKSLATLTPVLNDAKASIGNLDLSSYGSLTDVIMNLGKKTN